MSKTSGILLALLALAGLLVLWFVTAVGPVDGDGWVDREEDLPPSPQLFTNPYLMLQTYLEQQGYQVNVRRHVNLESEPLDSDTQTLLLFNAYQLLDETQSNALLRWVDNGGQVILTVEDAAGVIAEWESNYLFEEFEIYLENDLSQIESTRPGFEDYMEMIQDPSCYGASNDMAIAGHDLEFDFGSRIQFYIYDDNYYRLGDFGYDTTTPIVRLGYGSGSITIVNTSQIWNNINLRCFDHAWLMTHLLPDTEQVELVWFRQSASLWSLIWRYFPYFAGTLIVLLLVFLWRSSISFGIKHSLNDLRRRSLHEHLHAAGRFYVQKRQAEPIDKLRQRIHGLACKRIIGFLDADEQQQHELLAAHSKLSQLEIQQAMVATPYADVSVLTQIQLLQQLEQSLQPRLRN